MANAHFSSGATIPAEIAAKLKDFLPEFGDLNHEELLQHQECMFLSLQGYESNQSKAPSNDNVSTLSQFSSGFGESSGYGSFDQLELDEAFARSLQMEDELDIADTSHEHISQPSSFHSSTSRDVGGVSSTDSPHTHSHDVEHTPEDEVEHDDVNPDNMSYEELQSLGEVVGSESRGLPKKAIAKLPRSKFKTGMFFRKKEKQDCVICCMPFENGDEMIPLPCAHQYHSDCIIRWLEQRKNCPICQAEVP